MSNKIKFEHIKRMWFLNNGIVYSKRTGKPKTFPSKTGGGRRFQLIKVSGKYYSVCIHEAIYMLHHDRPVAEGKEIHHKDGNPENNEISNLIELTPKQHRRIHKYQTNDPMRGIHLYKGAWQFEWYDDNGKHHGRCFNEINDAMNFRAEIEEPRRRELRLLGLNCRKKYRGVTASQLRRISRKQNSRLFRTHI